LPGGRAIDPNPFVYRPQARIFSGA
jgi:hypothetical protein